MIILANKEVYRLDIKVGVTGDNEVKSKLTATEKMAEQTKKKMQDLDKIKVSPTAKLNDQASSKLDKLESKVSKLKSENVAVTAKIKDEITPTAEKIQKKTEKLKASNPTVKVKVKDEASTTLGKIDNKISSWLKIGAKKIISVGIAGTLALGGLGIGNAIKTFASFEQGLSNVKAVTQATDIEMKQLKDTALSLGASTAWSASAVTEAEQLLGQAGYTTSETITALPGLLSLASAGSLDLASATSIASSTLRGFNLDVSQTTHVADALALTANATNSDVTDLGESLKYISPVANGLGISMEDAVAATGLLSNQAIVGSQAGTILRQTMARLSSPTDEAAASMQKYGINAFDAQDNMKPLSAVVDNLNSSLGSLTSKQRADVISTIFGTESMSGVMALMNQGGESLSNLSTKLKEAQGTADKMAATKLDNLAGQWEQLSGAVETLKINLGEKLAPYAKQFVTWLTDKMPEIESKVVSIIDYVSNNVGTIKAMAGAVIAVGAAFTGLSIVGKVASSITSIKTLLGLTTAVTTATGTTGVGVAATGFSKLAASLKSSAIIAKLLPVLFSPVGLAVATIGVVGIAAAHELSKEVIPKVDLFANRTEISASTIKDANGNIVNVTQASSVKISDATKKNVGAYMEMDNKVQKALLNMKFTNSSISKEVASDLTTTFSTMGQTITTELDKDLTDSSTKLQSMFSKSSLSGAEQTDILAQIQNHYTNQKTITQKATEEINTILKTASENNKTLTADEYARIDELRTQMTTNAIISLSENEKESATILGRIKDQSTRVTAETASDVVKQLEDQRVKTIDSANVEYAERVRIAEAIRSEGGAKAEETANKIIGEAEKQRDKVIEGANATKTQGIDVLKQSYTDLENNVNTNTGAILTWWDRLAKWWNSHTFANKTATITTTATGAIESVGGGTTTTTYTNGYANKKTESSITATSYSSGYANQAKKDSDQMVFENGYLVKKNYTGTDNATPGLNSVAERGMELVLGRKFYNFKGGEKVLNNKQTLELLNSGNQKATEIPINKAYSTTNKVPNSTESKVFYLSNGEYKNDVIQSKQGQYQLATPQIATAGAIYSTGEIHVENNFNNDIEIDEFIEQACKTFGQKLKEALTNIKK